MTVRERTERHVIKPNNEYYGMLSEFCHLSKNLYNHANYLVRQSFLKEQRRLGYNELDRILKADSEFPDYRQMPTAQSAQQTLRLLDKNWKGFFAASRDYGKHKDKYPGRPKIPGYLDKNAGYVLVMTNQNCRLKDGILHFPKVFNGFTVKPLFMEKDGFLSFQQARFLKKHNRIILKLVYTISIRDAMADNGRYLGIDIGVDNLAACAPNTGDRPFLINGHPLKSMNQYYNKTAAYYQGVSKQINDSYKTKRLSKLLVKRDAKIKDYMHKASRYIIDYCMSHDIHTIVIGRNKDWKQKCPFYKNQKQHFVQLPFFRFIEMLKYKAEDYGITVILTEERYTSGTSFLDNEDPVKACYRKSRRIHRGLFVSNSGIPINADINAAYQMMKKAFPEVRDRGCVFQPAVVGLQ